MFLGFRSTASAPKARGGILAPGGVRLGPCRKVFGSQCPLPPTLYHGWDIPIACGFSAQITALKQRALEGPLSSGGWGVPGWGVPTVHTHQVSLQCLHIGEPCVLPTHWVTVDTVYKPDPAPPGTKYKVSYCPKLTKEYLQGTGFLISLALLFNQE
jgi:hypothetical protein